MSVRFYEQPVLNSPYEYPGRHWRLVDGVPTDHVDPSRRESSYVTPVPQPRRRRERSTQAGMILGVEGISTDRQEYDPTPIINEIRRRVDAWRRLPSPHGWGVSAATQDLLRHWRGVSHAFEHFRPFFCQVEAVETVIWLTEVTGILWGGRTRLPAQDGRIRDHLIGANEQANPDLLRIALKLATGAGKTTVMAMLIAWQAVNAARTPRSPLFTDSFLVVTPGITIRDRLRVLLPNDPDNYYAERSLVPPAMLGDVRRAKVVITNYHAFRRRERETISKGTRSLLQGRGGTDRDTAESEGQMLQRVMRPLLNAKNGVLVLNDEGHHCYRERPASEEVTLSGEERDEAERNNEAARLWISGLEAIGRRKRLHGVIDLSATPFFLRGSGYVEGTLFPWTVNDFSLMEAIECGIVKVPRVPVSDDAASANGPVFRNLWERIGRDLPRKGRRKSAALDPLGLPAELQSALDALYSHYAQVFRQWRDAGISEPPVFIVVCNSTATSKLVYDYIAGFDYPGSDDGGEPPWQGKLRLFSNYDGGGNRLASPRTLLIDSEQLESGGDLTGDFRAVNADAIARFRRERAQRVGADSDGVSEAELLREVMNTIGKPGTLGAGIRCVVSVSMLTEGWDANTVTHVLGVRAFGTQLLCEQVVGRALRRQSYDLNEDGLLEAEYADVLGVPFDFTAQPVIVAPKPPREVVRVHAVSPERDHLEITFPRVTGYRRELPEERLAARFDADSVVTLTPDEVGPPNTRNEGLVGEGVTLTPDHLRSTRRQTIAFRLAHRLLERHFREGGAPPKQHLFLQLRAITRRWLDDGYLRCEGGTFPAQVLYADPINRAVERIHAAIARAAVRDGESGESVVKAMVDPYNATGSTRQVSFTTSKQLRWQTRIDRSHVNWAVCDSGWEAEFCRVAEEDPRVLAYVKNQGLGLTVPYWMGETQRSYVPDFIVLLDDGRGRDDPLRVIVETKGYRRPDDADKQNAMRAFWIPGVNALGCFGRWEFVELRDVWRMREEFSRLTGWGVPAASVVGGGSEIAPTEGGGGAGDSERESRQRAGTSHDVRGRAGRADLLDEGIALERLARAGGSDPDAQYIPRRRSEVAE